MKTAIVYASVHHGNTKKLVDAIAKENEVDLIDATTTSQQDLSDYDLIGFASGIYGGNFHKAILKFASENLPENKRIFIMMTSAMNKDFSKSLMKVISAKNPKVAGKFSTVGFNTFGPFKLVGGTGKGHPDSKDLADAVAFYKGLVDKK